MQPVQESTGCTASGRESFQKATDTERDWQEKHLICLSWTCEKSHTNTLKLVLNQFLWLWHSTLNHCLFLFGSLKWKYFKFLWIINWSLERCISHLFTLNVNNQIWQVHLVFLGHWHELVSHFSGCLFYYFTALFQRQIFSTNFNYPATWSLFLLMRWQYSVSCRSSSTEQDFDCFGSEKVTSVHPKYIWNQAKLTMLCVLFPHYIFFYFFLGH